MDIWEIVKIVGSICAIILCILIFVGRVGLK